MNELKPLKKRKRGRPINEDRREEIITNAGKLFCELGLHATTMDHIARDLKMSKITLYSRFKDKDEIFTAVIKTKCQQYIPDQFFEDFEKYPMEQSLFRVAYGLMKLLTSDAVLSMELMLMEADKKVRSKLVALFYEAGPKRTKSMIAKHLKKLHIENKLYVPDPVFSANLFAAMIKGSDICMRYNMKIKPLASEKEMKKYCLSAVKMFVNAHIRN